MEAIVCIDLKFGIGKDGTIPWTNKKDLTWFRQKTLNTIVIMGRKTYESLPESNRPLKNRHNVVLTKQDINYPGAYTIHNLEDYKLLDCYNSSMRVVVIGGSTVYKQYSNQIKTFWITQLKKEYECDTFLDINLEKYESEKIYDDEEMTIFRLDHV